MMGKYTEGPWKAQLKSYQDGKAGYSIYEIQAPTKISSVCYKRVDGPLTEEDEANAQLIASAPALLEDSEGCSGMAGHRDWNWVTP